MRRVEILLHCTQQGRVHLDTFLAWDFGYFTTPAQFAYPFRNSLLRDTFDDLGTSPARDPGHIGNLTPFRNTLLGDTFDLGTLPEQGRGHFGILS